MVNLDFDATPTRPRWHEIASWIIAFAVVGGGIWIAVRWMYA